MTYDANKEYTIFKRYYDKVYSNSTNISQQDQIKMSNLTKKLQEETSLNKKLFERKKGEYVAYGDEV
jgi:hypothetical protein